MEYNEQIRLHDGRICVLKNAEGVDAQAFLEYFRTAHGETEYLTTYPDEPMHTPEEMAEHLERRRESETDIEICAFVDGRLVGSAGNRLVSARDKTKHRADYGISILKAYWGLGIGSALTAACIACAKKAGLLQLELELEAVSENAAAIALYTKFGFTEYGRNPRGFRTRDGRWQELVLMRLAL